MPIIESDRVCDAERGGIPFLRKDPREVDLAAKLRGTASLDSIELLFGFD